MKISGAASVLGVTNLDAALKFYTEVLGFREEFRVDQYAGVCREECKIHITTLLHPHDGKPGAGSVYIFCDEVDAYYHTVVDAHANVEAPPNDYPYGMRDFCVFDPDGNRLSFGCPVKK